MFFHSDFFGLKPSSLYHRSFPRSVGFCLHRILMNYETNVINF